MASQLVSVIEATFNAGSNCRYRILVHSALTAAPTMFLVRDGAFLQEPFHIRLGFYRENLDALAHAIVHMHMGWMVAVPWEMSGRGTTAHGRILGLPLEARPVSTFGDSLDDPVDGRSPVRVVLEGQRMVEVLAQALRHAACPGGGDTTS